MRRIAGYGLALLSLIAAAIWFNNTSRWTMPKIAPTLLAHRGLAQTYDAAGIDANTCTATRIHQPEHPYIENTIASMTAAFAAGAGIVELDIHPTTDGQFAVFHDWTLDCRTDGSGVTREATMTALKKLDVGYGYTADGGKTFPFRGKAVGLMPTLDEVLKTFADRRFLIHIKSNDPAEGEKLAARLAALPQERLKLLMVYGGERPAAVVRQKLPSISTMTKPQLKTCITRYALLGWSGHVPAECARSVILIPSNYARWLWGWPNVFVERMARVGSDVFVAGPLEGDGTSQGIDRESDLRVIPSNFAGGIWTNRVDRIAPLIRSGTR